jgi:PAS domain S-box-containing protein
MTPEQFLELGDLLPELLFLVNGEGHILVANRAALRTLGTTADGVSGRTLSEFVDTDNVHLMNYLRLCSGSKQPLIGSLSLTGADGETVALRCDGAVLNPASTAADVRICLRCIPRQASNSQFITLNRKIEELNREISARQHSEEQVRKLNEELEQRIDERTTELRHACQDLESFSYSVSHDLRAPLRGIHGFSHALLEDYGAQLDDTGLDYLKRVSASARKLDELIDDLLEFSRVGRRRIRHERVSLAALCADIVGQLRGEQPDRAVSVIIDERLEATGDAHLLHIVLDNLLRNAWKFTGKVEHARIECGTLEQDDERVFFVRDNGAGFDMRYADKLFDAFQRLHSSDEFAGTGIGLASVQRIVQRHGGRIWAESEVGKGATFYFTLAENAGNASRHTEGLAAG